MEAPDQIETPRLLLIRCDTEALREIAVGRSALLPPESGILEEPHALEAFLVEAPQDPGWCPWIITDRSSGSGMGFCGFKGSPCSKGSVEIAYWITPGQRRQGFAREAVRGLCKTAFRSSLVREVIAHTLTDAAASHRVLEYCGFRRSPRLLISSDGPLWLWQLEQN